MLGLILAIAKNARHDYDRRLEDVLRELARCRAANRELVEINLRYEQEIARREQAIAGLLNRLNAVTVAKVVAYRTCRLGLPLHRVDPHQFNPN